MYMYMALLHVFKWHTLLHEDLGPEGTNVHSNPLSVSLESAPPLLTYVVLHSTVVYEAIHQRLVHRTLSLEYSETPHLTSELQPP